MNKSKIEWKRKASVILSTSIMMVVCMMPMTVLAEEPADDVYKMTDIDEPPRILKAVRPKVPYEAVAGNVRGRVVLSAVVTKEGTPEQLEVIEAEPMGVFENAALEAFRQYRFTPAKKNGEAVDVMVRIPIQF